VTSLAVLTPSYAPDFDLCRTLNRSVLACTPPDVEHHVIVPRRNVELFSSLRSPRTKLWTVEQFLPRRMIKLPTVNAWLNVRRPYPPVRGWVMQQVVKLGAAAEIEADVLLLVDSDVVLVRPITADTFRTDGRIRFFRLDGEVDGTMRRHLIWHDVAHRLLGLSPAEPPPLPDYIRPFNVWERRVVLELLDHVERVTGRPWLDTIASQLHVSEFILYGVFVDRVLGESADVFPASSMLCHTYWNRTPMDSRDVDGFVRELSRDDVAVMISAKSHTTPAVRRQVLAGVLAVVQAEQWAGPALDAARGIFL
jgi:Family of unknown function (DUF6492)